MKKSFIAIFFLFQFFTIIAQTLTEEVVIDREITPVVRQVSRPSWVSPTLLTPSVQTKPLSFNEFFRTAEINRTLTPLEPVEWADSVMRSPYRGYASLGYFPVYNLGAAAGYRFLVTEKNNAGLKFAYDGGKWNGFKGSEGSNVQHNIILGADATMTFTPGVLKAAFDYRYSSTDMSHYTGYYDRGTQALNSVDFRVKWLSKTSGTLKWDVGANFEYGGFTKSKTDRLGRFIANASQRLDPAKDIVLGLNTNLSYPLKEKSGVSLAVDLKFRHVSAFNRLVPEMAYLDYPDRPYGFAVCEEHGSTTMAVISLAPAYYFQREALRGHVGVNVDFNAGGLQHKVRIAPEVNLQWRPDSKFAVALRATGGEVLNSNSELWKRDPWMTGVFSAERSHVNADVDLSLTFGSYKGFHAVLHGGYTSVSDWACPVLLQDVNTWGQCDNLNGWNFGVELGYSWKKMVDLVGHFEGATPSKYYRWQDNAKWAFDVSAKIRPIKKLQVSVGYAGRLDRSGYILESVPQGNKAVFASSQVSLGNTSNLFVGGEYEFTPSLSFFIKAENLLNRHWLLTTNVRAQGIHGLVGAQYKF